MPDQIIELGLFRRRKSDSVSLIIRLGKLLGRLFRLVSEIAVESESLKTSEFRSQLEQRRARLDQVTEDDILETTVEECIELCNDYFKQAQGYLQERETELRDVVDVLRDAIGSLSGESDTFSQRLLDSSVRFKRLTEIEDLRELKRQIIKEVGDLTQMVAEKKKKDELLYAKMSKRFDLLREKFRQTKEEVLLDSLTNIGNRRSIDLAIKRASCQPEGKRIILAMLDLDDFKKINDCHGHAVGDQALKCVARWLNIHIRAGDFLGRYGGDEFVVLLADTTLAQAEKRLSQLLEQIAASQFEYREGREIRSVKVAVSCGLAELRPAEMPEEVLRRADKALYEAKKRGKNRVYVEKKA